MTLQRERNPLDPTSAVARAIELIGADAVADAVDRSPNTVRMWADPERDESPRHALSLLIDAACLRLTDEAPFAALYDRHREACAQTQEDPLSAGIRANESIGALLREVSEAVSSTSESGRRISNNERARLMRRLAEATDELGRMQRALVREGGA